MCARSPAHYFEVSEPTISVHLKILKRAGLIIGEKKKFLYALPCCQGAY
ncbi:MAG: winged helix-turn-helix transcriptional regulator [Lentisphaeria bacterium]|nr:winged helix-turn-helix transcriptional regulator [Lentisphaeria bacterium]